LAVDEPTREQIQRHRIEEKEKAFVNLILWPYRAAGGHLQQRHHDNRGYRRVKPLMNANERELILMDVVHQIVGAALKHIDFCQNRHQ